MVLNPRSQHWFLHCFSLHLYESFSQYTLQSPMKISLVFITVFYYWVCLRFRVFGHSGHCLEDQKLLLLQLKKNLKFNSIYSVKPVFWNESAPCGQWSGVTWDEKGHVAGLDLSEESLSGGLDNSNALFSLQYLSHLNLAFNNFNSVIPSRIKDLKSLISLNFSNAGFVGQIPMEIEQLTRLNILDLSYYSGASAMKIENPNLLKLVQNLSEVRELYLDGINIAFKGNEWGHALSSFLPHLQVLSMSSCNLSGPIASSLETLQNLTELAYLDLSFNYFTGPILPFDMARKLIYLDLSHNALYERIPVSICNASNLQVLDLSHNNFSGVIPHCLAKSDTLGVLNLGKNKLSVNIPDTFQVSCTLKTLDLSSNNLKGPIPKSLSDCTTLEVLDIGNNMIDDRFPCLLKTITTLRVMVLRGNNFHGPIECPNIRGMIWKELQIVDLAFNNFNGMLPGEFFATWKALMLDGNETASKANQIDFNFFRFGQMNYQDRVIVTMKGQEMTLTRILTVLPSVDFSSNHIEGSIPEEMMDFTALNSLKLSNNNLSGHIPSSIWKLQQLESLDLSNNSFTGEIPSKLANLSCLSILNLSYNHLVGSIPTGTQLQSFAASSFQGNDGLYGPPLTQSPNTGAQELMPQPPPPPPPPPSESDDVVDFRFIIGLEVGVAFGLGIIIGPLYLWKQWRIRYWKCVDFILCSIFPQLYLDYQRREGRWFRVLRWSH